MQRRKRKHSSFSSFLHCTPFFILHPHCTTNHPFLILKSFLSPLHLHPTPPLLSTSLPQPNVLPCHAKFAAAASENWINTRDPGIPKCCVTNAVNSLAAGMLVSGPICPILAR